jgi:hypothetical protein
MKTTLSRWLKNLFNLFTPEINIRSLGVSEREIKQQLDYYEN